MNRIKTDDNIKVLAVSILDDQKHQEFLACQDGSSLIRIRLKNSIFEKIPFQTVFYAQGKVNQSLSTGDTLTIDIDLDNDENRFVSFSNDSLKFDRTFSVHDHLKSLERIPDLSDKKNMPHEHELEYMDFFALKNHAHYVKIIREELECGDFTMKPPYIKGTAYEQIYTDYINRTKIQEAKFGLIDRSTLESKLKPMKVRKLTDNNQPSIKRKNIAMVQ